MTHHDFDADQSLSPQGRALVRRVILQYYPAEDRLRHVLLTHSQSVMHKALQIVSLHPELQMDREFVAEAAMLHDIGIFRCDAPGIFCFGTAPYICHGRIGAELLRACQLPRHARVCERHTGAGITKDEIIKQHLPLPAQDFVPETLEEQVVCYADKFFSKSHLELNRTVEQAEQSLLTFGPEGVERFRRWVKMFE